MEQVVEKFPSVLGLALENMEEHVEFLLNKVGVREAKLGKVRYCLLFAYYMFQTLPCFKGSPKSKQKTAHRHGHKGEIAA